jgi:F420-non-reducing hydrogenase iron-sulfur subunit
MRVMCTGRVDLSFILRAFLKGADGVFIGGCHLNECNYTTHGNFYALRISHICKKLMQAIGIDPRRLSIEFISGAEGNRFAEIVTTFTRTIYELGPLGKEDGNGQDGLTSRLEAAMKIVPYVKLLERERLRVQFPTREEFDEFFSGEEFSRLFNETIAEKLAISQIASLLKDKPLPSGEIARILGLTPSEVSRHLGSSSRHGLVRYDEKEKCYALT